MQGHCWADTARGGPRGCSVSAGSAGCRSHEGGLRAPLGDSESLRWSWGGGALGGDVRGMVGPLQVEDAGPGPAASC